LAVEKVERESGSILDTAAILKNLDLLISVDTMPAHLAGALGRPVWTLLPFAPDWRWMRDRSDTPWYPSMRLFRQPRPGDWASVMASVAEQLRIRPMDSFKSLDFRPI
jgi:ADP-heptose:LPS heptosyltransferase